MQTNWRSCLRTLVASILGGAMALSAAAADLRIGIKAEVTSADPHVLNGQNRNVWMQVYEGLVAQDENLRTIPALAVSWKPVGTNSWEFKLRPGVRFHDGTLLTAEDAKFSIDRAKTLVGPRTFRSYLRDVEATQVVDASTLLIKTVKPSPALPDNLGLIAIVPRSIGTDASEDSFAKGTSAIGTGPYKFSEWLHGQRLVLSRFDRYWGQAESWDKVTFHFIPKDPARASALLAGSVDLIDGAPSALKERFTSNGNIEMASTPSYMLNYLYLDRARTPSPYVTGPDGKALERNPFDDLRVRQAMSMAINRATIARHVMRGDSVEAAQYVPEGFFGHVPGLALPQPDLAAAKRLLAEAGYPQGFSLALHCPNDRYPNDAKVCEAIGQMFTQVGIKTDVKTLPFAVLQPRSLTGGKNGEPEFSVGMLGIGAVTGSSFEPISTTTVTYDKKTGAGANNRARYTNKDVDALIAKAGATFNDKEREELLQAAAKLAIADVAIIPIHNIKAGWAYRKDLSFKARADGFTLASSVKPVVDKK